MERNRIPGALHIHVPHNAPRKNWPWGNVSNPTLDLLLLGIEHLLLQKIDESAVDALMKHLCVCATNGPIEATKRTTEDLLGCHGLMKEDFVCLRDAIVSRLLEYQVAAKPLPVGEFNRRPILKEELLNAQLVDTTELLPPGSEKLAAAEALDQEDISTANPPQSTELLPSEGVLAAETLDQEDVSTAHPPQTTELLPSGSEKLAAAEALDQEDVSTANPPQSTELLPSEGVLAAETLDQEDVSTAKLVESFGNITAHANSSTYAPSQQNQPDVPVEPSLQEIRGPEPILNERGEKEWYIDKIIDEKPKGRGKEYLVSWRGFGPEHNTWLPAKNLAETQALDLWEGLADLD